MILQISGGDRHHKKGRQPQWLSTSNNKTVFILVLITLHIQHEQYEEIGQQAVLLLTHN